MHDSAETGKINNKYESHGRMVMMGWDRHHTGTLSMSGPLTHRVHPQSSSSLTPYTATVPYPSRNAHTVPLKSLFILCIHYTVLTDRSLWLYSLWVQCFFFLPLRLWDMIVSSLINQIARFNLIWLKILSLRGLTCPSWTSSRMAFKPFLC